MTALPGIRALRPFAPENGNRLAREIDHWGQSSRRASRGAREDAKKCPENAKGGREVLPRVANLGA